MTALNIFLSIASQWRVAPSGFFFGLDYAAARAGIEMAGLALTPDLWADVRVIESGAIAVFNGA